jgi:hypothetical protein
VKLNRFAQIFLVFRRADVFISAAFESSEPISDILRSRILILDHFSFFRNRGTSCPAKKLGAKNDGAIHHDWDLLSAGCLIDYGYRWCISASAFEGMLE